MEDRLISLKAAIDAVSDWLYDGDDKRSVDQLLSALPPAQPEPSTEVQEILDYLDNTLHPIVSPDNWYVYSELHDMVSKLLSAQPEPSQVARDIATIIENEQDMRVMLAQPEIKPIDYQDCANAMLRMWMDNVVTDGEYNRIMDKLNVFWRTRNERHD